MFLALPSTEALSFGSSKLFQIITPLATYMILQEIPWLNNLFPRIVRSLKPQADVQKWDRIFKMLIGFTTWKIGCDFGFLIVNTGAAPWSIAFTFIGLIPYAVLMYVIYYLIGQRMIIEGRWNPFNDRYIARSLKGRPSRLKQFFSKFFHESLNTTSANVPLRQVCIKPFLDYGAILITWPMYNVALLFSQSGEINFAPLFQFSSVSSLVFYIVNVFGFILGFNLGEFIYFRAHFAIESVKLLVRNQQLAQKVKQLFTIFDANQDGSISELEFRQAMRALGQDPTNSELCLILQEADLDQSGSLEFNEFQAMLLSKQDTRRVKLLLDEATPASNGIFKRLITFFVLQWQVTKNNTTYIRIQGFLRRYGLNNRWLLSGGLGLVFIVLLEPSLAHTLFSWHDQVQHSLFYTWGTMDTVHLQQVLASHALIELPSPHDLATSFPTQLAHLYSQPEIQISYQTSVE